MTKNLKKKITALGSTRIWKFDNDKNEDAKKYKLLVLTRPRRCYICKAAKSSLLVDAKKIWKRCGKCFDQAFLVYYTKMQNLTYTW